MDTNVSYSVWFNRRHQRSGHLFQGRFKSILVDPQGWGLELSRYVHLNPVRVRQFGLDKAARQQRRAGVIARPDGKQARARIQRLRAYRWSSCRAYIGVARAPAWLRCEDILKSGGGPRPEALAAYRNHVESALRQGLAESPWENVRDQMVLGSARFVRNLAPVLGKKASRRGGGRFGGPTIAEIVRAVEEVKGEKWEQFRDRHGDWGAGCVGVSWPERLGH